MKKPDVMHVLVPVTALFIAIMASACGGADKPEDVAEAPTGATAVVEQTPAQAAETITKEPTATTPPSPTATPTSTPLPTPTPTPIPEDIEVIAQGFGQDENKLGYAFLVRNNHKENAFELTKYQLSIYDEDGKLVDVVSDFIEIISPGETQGIGNTMYLDKGVVVSDIDIQIVKGKPTSPQTSPLVAENGAYFSDDYFDVVTGVLKNTVDTDLRSVRVAVVAYNEAGEIVGGGSTYVNFIPANSQTGIAAYVTFTDDMATMELYPTVTGLTFFEREAPEGANAITLVDYGFVQKGQNLIYGLLVENPNENFAVEQSQYRVTAYAEDGLVLGAGDGYVNLLLPDQALAAVSPLILVEGENMDVAKLDVQVLTGEFTETEPLPQFTAEDILYSPNERFPSVTGQIVNPYDKEFKNVQVTALLYNEAGEIIGAGSEYLDLVAANGKTPVEVSVTTTAEPATVELYATVSTLSAFK